MLGLLRIIDANVATHVFGYTVTWQVPKDPQGTLYEFEHPHTSDAPHFLRPSLRKFWAGEPWIVPFYSTSHVAAADLVHNMVLRGLTFYLFEKEGLYTAEFSKIGNHATGCSCIREMAISLAALGAVK